jgi:predicted AlkP superfamily phosphohydrolase/phosphomutase
MKLSNNNRRTFILGLDGMPYSFLDKNFAQGKMSYLAKIAQDFGMKRINSVYPTVSSVAWTSYMTGENPAKHNIFGFADRVANPFKIRIPTAKDRRADTIWSLLSGQGKRVIVINVPLTYPPEDVNGILVSGFLCPDIEKSSYPQQFSNYLKARDYIIDVDAWLARNNQKRIFMERLHKALEKRFKISLELMEKEEWDFFQLHIMETDRLFHFFWNEIDKPREFSKEIKSFFEKLNDFIGNVCARLSDKDRLLILSDHGFCAVKKEVQLNRWLEEQGFLKFDGNAKRELANYDRTSLCYSLVPGRIFINLKGREERGSVSKNDYEKLRQDIKKRLLNLQNPENGERVIDKVFFREEIYEGPYVEDAADIIAHPTEGYDLKGKVDANSILDSSSLNGMHTYNDAFICGINFDLDSVTSVQDIKDIIIN